MCFVREEFRSPDDSKFFPPSSLISEEHLDSSGSSDGTSTLGGGGRTSPSCLNGGDVVQCSNSDTVPLIPTLEVALASF